jgi:hypothetical protein
MTELRPSKQDKEVPTENKILVKEHEGAQLSLTTMMVVVYVC